MELHYSECGKEGSWEQSVTTDESDLKMGSPRSVEGRARIYGCQGLLSDDRLWPHMVGLKHLNFHFKTTLLRISNIRSLGPIQH